jgi:DNA-binding HxlR family transcriptional regulator
VPAAKPQPDSPTRDEAFHRVQEMLHCKWTIAVIDAIDRGHTRPSAIQRSLRGLTAKILHDRLNKLERYGLIRRERFAETPPRVEVTFTPRGTRLLRLIRGMRAFAEAWSGSA